MRPLIAKFVRIAFALTFLGLAGGIIWAVMWQLFTWPELAAGPIGVLAFGSLVFLCWPPGRKKALGFLLLAVAWASLDVASWLRRGESLRANLRGVLVLIGLWLSWIKWDAIRESPFPSAR